MNLDLEQFKGTYVVESLELLGDMEVKLLELEQGDDDVELLNAIFRCVHSIKGGAGAFGFSKITNFTHEFEFLLDSLREHKLEVNSDIVDILFAGRDIVENMVFAARDGEEVADDFGINVLDSIKNINQTDSKILDEISDELPVTQIVEIPQNNEIYMYNIYFKPYAELFKTGNEPSLLFRELSNLGELIINCNIDNLPNISDIIPEDCYISWNLDFDSNISEAEIREVFEFVEDICDLEIDVLGGFLPPNENLPPDDYADIALNEKKPAQNDISLINNADVKINKKIKESPKDLPKTPIKKVESSGSIRVDLDKIDRLVNMVGELVITQGMLSMQAGKMPKDSYPEISLGVEELATLTRELQESVMAVRMQPVKSIFSRMPRVVRDLSRKLNKKMRLETYGEETEIDKTIIEQLGDPLTHMLRNSIDHGIEMPEVRLANGKQEEGVITLSAANHGGRIEITISDDGWGINREKVRSIAIEKGVINEDDNLSTEEIDYLIFAAGFSTADEVSDISGRGVGMDVVKRNIESMGGIVTLENNPSKGSKFTISLPLTLAILDGMAVKAGNEQYIIPIANTIESLHPEKDSIKHLSTGIDLINVRGEFIPLLYLWQMFDIKYAKKDPMKSLVILVDGGKDKFGIVVDGLLGQQQVVIKSLEQNMEAVDGISGATILGDGKVSLILDVAELYRIGVDASRAEIAKIRENQKYA